MKELIRVGMADLNACKCPGGLTTLGLGSCVGVTLYDSQTKVGGMVHVMLPDSTRFKHTENPAKYADTGIALLIEKMEKLGADRKRLSAKIAGGAQMFAFKADNEMLRIGERNVEATKQVLKKHKIEIIAEDTGLNYGRTVELFCDDGRFHIKAVGKSNKTI